MVSFLIFFSILQISAAGLCYVQQNETYSREIVRAFTNSNVSTANCQKYCTIQSNCTAYSSDRGRCVLLGNVKQEPLCSNQLTVSVKNICSQWNTPELYISAMELGMQQLGEEIQIHHARGCYGPSIHSDADLKYWGDVIAGHGCVFLDATCYTAGGTYSWNDGTPTDYIDPGKVFTDCVPNSNVHIHTGSELLVNETTLKFLCIALV